MSRKVSFLDKGSMKFKLIVSLSFIAAILLLSHFISIIEYNRVRDILTNNISADIRCLNAAQDLALFADDQNMRILNAVNTGAEKIDTLAKKDVEQFYDIISNNSTVEEVKLASLKLFSSYDIYRIASNQYNDLIARGDTLGHPWYLENIKPLYATMRHDMDAFKSALNENLKFNSENVEADFYRSIVPGTVADLVGLLLITLLAYFIISYYVNPIYKMLKHLQSHSETGKRYTYEFEGDDQLTELNSKISEVIEENTILKRRIKALKDNN